MSDFEQYAERYETVRMERRGGILQVTFHTEGGPLRWGALPHREFPQAFREIGADPENAVVILTGTGDAFSGPPGAPRRGPAPTARDWDRIHREGRELLENLLAIEAPMIAAINGPALRHSEIPLLCDVVLAAEEASFQDSAHFMNGLTPGDGVHVVYPLLMGWNRGRYFLLTGQTLTAEEALGAGLVSEILPGDRLLPRAWEIAERLAEQPPLVLRYSRLMLTQHLKRLMHDLLGYGLALEGLAALDGPPDRA